MRFYSAFTADIAASMIDSIRLHITRYFTLSAKRRTDESIGILKRGAQISLADFIYLQSTRSQNDVTIQHSNEKRVLEGKPVIKYNAIF